MPILNFLTANSTWLGAGVLMTLSSSFGQTFFISIFAGEIRAEFNLSHSDWGNAYTIGTLASAAIMIMVGPLADRMKVRKLAAFVIVGLAGMCCAMAVSNAAWLLPVIICGLRFFGQGMLTHIPAVAVGRWFRANRGRAISVVFLGHSLGQALFPAAFVMVMSISSWRSAWLFASLFPLIALMPLIFLLKHERQPQQIALEPGGTGILNKHWKRKQVLQHWLFWATFPGFLAQPIFSTALAFQQVHLSEIKGWSHTGFASLFAVMTMANIFGLWVAGGAIDRFGVARILPVMLLPAAAGYALIANASGLDGAAVGMALVGLSTGVIAAVGGAYWPEIYGTKYLGSIRSMATAIMVFATALGPLVTGYLIDAGVDLRDQLRGISIISVLASFSLGLAIWHAWPLLRSLTFQK
jgi:MFS family permease